MKKLIKWLPLALLVIAYTGIEFLIGYNNILTIMNKVFYGVFVYAITVALVSNLIIKMKKK